MAKVLQLRRGTTTAHGSFTGKIGEVTMDTDKKTLVVHDGSTAGGNPLVNKAEFDSHTHTKSDITDFNHTHTKSNITDFTHTHAISDVNGLSAALENSQVGTAINNALSELIVKFGGTVPTVS